MSFWDHLKPAEKPLFSQTGPASWYRPKLQRRTASGEAFDAGAFTAAHRSLPFGTVIRVTCLKTGKMVKVRVNGRMEVLSCQISNEALADKEMLEDLIGAAVNQAIEISSGYASTSVRKRR